VILDFKPALAAETRKAFWARWRSFLDDHGLCAEPHAGATGESLTVVAEGTQATESDRLTTDAWFATRDELQSWRISELGDVRPVVDRQAHTMR
jgi:hypothetical protein